MSENTLPSISLNCIVKNESKVIERMLKSVAPLIDYYVIVDTGSTDNTKEIIKQTMDDLGIPGEIHDHVWVDFCTARNHALECVKGKAKWGFWIDADEQFVPDERFNKNTLLYKMEPFEIGSTPVIYGPQKYFRSQLFRIDLPWEWKGAVHEVMMLPKGHKPATSGMIEGFHTLVTPDGASWGDGSKETQRKKYSQHAEMLEEYIKTNDDVRWLFYLAQSYRDSFQFEKAEEWYSKRVAKKEGYWEEIYFSQLMVAGMKARQNKPIGEVLGAYMECNRYDLNRCDHLLPIMRHYQAQRDYVGSYMISKYCYDTFKKNPFPKSTLFIDNTIYDWQILDIHCVNLYYLGKFAEARSVYNKLRKQVNKGLVPTEHAKRIVDGANWYTKEHEKEKKIKMKMHPQNNQKIIPAS